jgi:glycosyltransferase involved in cell wall biosynthesis
MIKYVKTKYESSVIVRPLQINDESAIKYIGQSGTSGYACAAKGYLANYVLNNVPVTWYKLLFDNSSNDVSYYVDALAESASHNKYNEYDTLIMHSTPDIWGDFIFKHKNVPNIIGYCTWETSRLPDKWVECINLVSDVWVPSTFNKQCFIDSGVKSNITVVPHVWHKQNLLNKDSITIYDYCRNKVPSKKYTFYSIGELNARKGIEDLIVVFDRLNDIYTDTQLILKLHYKEYGAINKQHCIDVVKNLTNKLGTSIYLILENLTNREVLALHSFGDCYVSLNKGEGFGLTIFDAFNYGKKVITTGYGGHVDFLGSNYEGLVKYKIDKVSGMTKFSTNYSVDQLWSYPDLDHAYSLMEKMLSSSC